MVIAAFIAGRAGRSDKTVLYASDSTVAQQTDKTEMIRPGGRSDGRAECAPIEQEAEEVETQASRRQRLATLNEGYEHIVNLAEQELTLIHI